VEGAVSVSDGTGGTSVGSIDEPCLRRLKAALMSGSRKTRITNGSK
jgi:hypothetical protein